MSEIELSKWLGNAFGPTVGGVITLVLFFLGWKNVKPTLAGADAQSALIKNLQDERDEHKDRADKLQEQINLLREEVAAMKMYLRLKFGVTEADFKAEMKSDGQ